MKFVDFCYHGNKGASSEVLHVTTVNVYKYITTIRAL